MSVFPHGNVFSNGFIERATFDHHGFLPYENLFTNITTDNPALLYASGGRSTWRPHSGRYTTFWNFHYPGSPQGLPSWPQMNVIGLPGYSNQTGGSGTWVESMSNLCPPNLHEAQKAKRLGLSSEDRPTAILITDGIGGRAPVTIQFDGSRSITPEGSIVSYQWDFGDGSVATGPMVSHTYGTGIFEASLTVSNSQGLTSTQTVTIHNGELVTLQAEDATLTTASVENSHAGYLGSGFVNLGPSGSSVEWSNVDGGAGGLVDLSFRYALGNDPRGVNLVVNGVSQSLSFPNSGGWAEWAEEVVTVRLEAGANNVIRIETTGMDSANIDQLSLPKFGVVSLQAEDAILSSATIETVHAGFHGTGMVNLGFNDSSVQWVGIDGGEGGVKVIGIRYALGNATGRTTQLIVNGEVQQVTFLGTGGWANWEVLNVPVSLLAGAVNTVQIETVGQDAGNIDELLIPSDGLFSYDSWQGAQSWGVTPVSLRDAEDDPDFDGVSNGLEWVLGSSPVDGGSMNLLKMGVDEGMVSFDFPKSSSKFSSRLHSSLDMETWMDVPQSVERYHANTGRYFYEHPIDLSLDYRQFYRVVFEVD